MVCDKRNLRLTNMLNAVVSSWNTYDNNFVLISTLIKKQHNLSW